MTDPEAALGASPRPLWRTRTVRGFLFTLSAMVLLVGGLYLLMPIEQMIFGASHLTERPFASAMQIVGLPHIVIGFLFMATSLKMQNARSRIAIGATLFAAAGLCGLFYLAGGPDARPRLPMAAVPHTSSFIPIGMSGSSITATGRRGRERVDVIYRCCCWDYSAPLSRWCGV